MTDTDFPWHIGVYDAHCHIGNVADIESSRLALSHTKARGLLSLASHAQNQHSQAELARVARAPDSPSLDTHLPYTHVIPGFGYHPWSSYELYNDLEAKDTSGPLQGDAKIRHYQSILYPKTDDRQFLLALPDPQPLSAFLDRTRARLADHPLALVAEIGLDKSFRIPVAWLPGDDIPSDILPGGRGGRRLSPYRVELDHQTSLLKAQLELAAEMGRPVSVHGVQAHGSLFDVLSSTWKGHELSNPSNRRKKTPKRQDQTPSEETADHGLKTPSTPPTPPPPPPPYPPRICLHSFSGSPSLLKQYLDPKIPADIFFSFSTFNNFSKDYNKAEASVKEVPDHRLLLETDMSRPGPHLDDQLVITARKLCELKGWEIEHGLSQMRDNYLRFVYGRK